METGPLSRYDLVVGQNARIGLLTSHEFQERLSRSSFASASHLAWRNGSLAPAGDGILGRHRAVGVGPQ